MLRHYMNTYPNRKKVKIKDFSGFRNLNEQPIESMKCEENIRERIFEIARRKHGEFG